MKIKICIIGGGSVNWMRILMKDIYALRGVEGGEIRLVDPNVPHVTSVKNMAEKFNEASDKNFEISIVEDRKEALRDCNFVIIVFSDIGRWNGRVCGYKIIWFFFYSVALRRVCNCPNSITI